MYKKSNEVTRATFDLKVGQWIGGSRLAYIKEDGGRVFIHPNKLGSVHARFIKIFRLKKAGGADINDPISVLVSLDGMASGDQIRHLKAISRIIDSHVDSLQRGI